MGAYAYRRHLIYVDGTGAEKVGYLRIDVFDARSFSHTTALVNQNNGVSDARIVV